MASKPKIAFSALVVLVAVGVLPSVAQAAFPGENGLIAFGTSNGIETIAPDGSSRTLVRPNGGVPVWSPDGTQIVYTSDGPPSGIYTMTAAGEPRTQCPCSSSNSSGEGAFFEWPTWAPDGFRIAFAETDFLTDQVSTWVDVGRPGVGASSHTFEDLPNALEWGTNNKIFFWARQTDGGIGGEIHALGGGDTTIRSVPFEVGDGLTVSPDGSRIAFASERSGSPDRAIYRSQSDGTGVLRLSGPAPAKDTDPAWSPDGSKIVFESTRDGNTELYVMNTDGSNQTRLTNTPSLNEYFPDWQPIPNGYPRPKSATPTYVPMVVAYGACGSATKVHAAPLGWGSCTAQQSSGQLTVGTPDANSRLPNGGGWVRLKAILDDTTTPADDESDLSIDVNAEDVRKKSDLTDYSGELRLTSVVRATDKLNGPAPTPSGLDAATLRDVTFGPSVPCTSTDDPASTVVGSTCSISTTVNTLIPGLIVGGARTIWQLGQINLNDGGPDSDGDTAADNTPFMRQGIFAP